MTTLDPTRDGGQPDSLAWSRCLLESRATEQVETGSALEAILDGVAVPVWVLDPQGLVLLANRAALDVLGLDGPAELQGQQGHGAVHSMHCVPIDLPTGRGTVMTFIDTSAQREAEQSLCERDIAAEADARRRTIEAADAARAKLARDLHDGAQQQFVSALVNFQLAAKTASSDADAATAFQEAGVALTKAGVEELRALAAGIHPAILTDHGLGPAVEALASRAPVPVSVVQTLDRRLPAGLEASLYFFISEALTNIVKHARAEVAWVRIGTEDGRLDVVVADDGIGGATATAAGIGLAGSPTGSPRWTAS